MRTQMICQCASEQYYCEIHVECDEGCMALLEPVTHDEIRAAYVHWRYHHAPGGCAHGA